MENKICSDYTDKELYRIIKNDIIPSFPREGEDILINATRNYTFQITSSKNELDILKGNKNNTNRLSIIDLNECGDILIDFYNLTTNDDLLIIKYENFVSDVNEKSIQYEVYDISTQPYTKLNLSICLSASIDIYIPVNLKEETLQLYHDLKSYGYDLFDKNDKFYNDICTLFKSKNGTDVLLSDRYNDFYQSNELGCQENCQYSDFSIESQYLKCECKIIEQNEFEMKQPEKLSAKSLVKSFVNVLKYSNYKVLKCDKLIFNKKSFYENTGSILSIVYFFGYLISFIFFCYRRLYYLKVEIEKLLENKTNHIINDNKGININKDENNIIIVNKDNILQNKNDINTSKFNKRKSTPTKGRKSFGYNEYNFNNKKIFKGNLPPKKQIILKKRNKKNKRKKELNHLAI